MDQPVKAVLNGTLDTADLLTDVLNATDPQAEVEERLDSAAKQFAEALVGYDPLGTLEAIRASSVG